MSYRKNLYNPEAHKAETALREREAIKRSVQEHAMDMYSLLDRICPYLERHADLLETETRNLLAKIKAGQ